MNSRNSFAAGMLLNLALIVVGLIFLVYLSTLSGQSLKERLDFYSTTAGNYVGIMLLLIPYMLLFQWIFKSDNTRSIKSVLLVCVVVGGIQIVLASFSPLLLEGIDHRFQELGSFIEILRN